MRLRLGSTVRMWYRYPSERFPRTVIVRITHDGCAIGDAVAASIARDRGLAEIATSPTPACDMMRYLQAHPDEDAAHALSFAAIQPPAFYPDSGRAMPRRRARPWGENRISHKRLRIR